MPGRYPEESVRRLITLFLMTATIMNTLDTTIANVALPHMQGSVSASADEITWVLTSYIVAAAICTPLTGWLAGRFGRKRLLLTSVVTFTIASGLCGAATNLEELVLFRLLQGIFGAALVPMSQVILLDINPPERHGPAMAIWGMGAVLGPVIGPALGGYLTDNFDWRWVFLINVPLGAVTFVGLSFFAPESKSDTKVRLDFTGFAMLGIAIGAMQLMLDRGQTQDWFNATEICIEGGIALLSFTLFVIHTLTARNPFIDPGLFADRNFSIGLIMGFVIGALLFSIVALLPPMLENLFHYPVMLTGWVTVPRGLGSLLGMLAGGRLIRRIDSRLLIFAGFLISALATYDMTNFSLGMNARPVMVSGFVHGFSTGIIFIALTTLAFGTLHARFRNDGSAMFNLLRNLGASVGIAVLQALTVRNGAIVHARLTEGIRPDSPALSRVMPDLDFTRPAQLAGMNAEVTRQASMVAYIDSFWFLFVVSLAAIPLILLMRKPLASAAPPEAHME